PLQSRDDAVMELSAAFAARGRIRRIARAELAVGLLVIPFELFVGPALEFPVVALAQRDVVDDIQIERGGDRSRGLPRAPSVAGVQRPQPLARQASREPASLIFAVRGQPAVGVVALDPALAIPLSFAVADQDDPGFSHGAP